jgi:hypothetical protein
MADQDDQTVADLLKTYQPGFLPYPVFEQIARLVALPIIEFIPLRMRDGEVEVLLIARPEDDPLWPGLLHTPGTVIRATDLHDGQDNWPAFKRIVDDELQHTEIGNPHYVGSIFHQSKRGAEQAQLYWVEVRGEPHVGTFYPADKLPDDLIESQKTFINEAVRHFRQHGPAATEQ